jgi:hypothetical protein
MSKENNKLYVDKEIGKNGLKICYHGSARPFSTKTPELSSNNHQKNRVEGAALEFSPGLVPPGPCEAKLTFNTKFFELNFAAKCFNVL